MDLNKAKNSNKGKGRLPRLDLRVMPRPATDKPVCLDLYCGAGGAAVGYARAGFYVIGIDKEPQPNYPYDFYQADARFVKIPDWVDFVHASPECQKHSITKYMPHVNLEKYNDDIEIIRKKLEATGKPFVIENVLGAPLKNPLMLHGKMFGLRVIRKRLFESNLFLMTPPVPNHRDGSTNSHRGYSSHANGAKYITVAGNNYSLKDGKAAMDIDHMQTKKELAQAIPPIYTEFLGRQILEQIAQRQAV